MSQAHSTQSATGHSSKKSHSKVNQSTKPPTNATSNKEKSASTSKKSVCKYPLTKYDISANWQRLQNELKSKKPKQKNKQKSNKPGGNKKVNTNGANVANKLPSGAVAATAVAASNEVWFDDVDPCLIKSSLISSSAVVVEKKLCKETSFDGLTRFVAMDCEMVGAGFDGTNSILARVSLVNLYGHCVYDKFVKPTEEVTDYRTDVSGIRPQNLVNGEEFKIVQQEVYDIIKNRILVGHAIHHDLKVLYLSQPKHMIRDTSSYFKKFFNNRTPSLKKLSEVYLGGQIQSGEHDSITDAQATMRLYTLFKKKWESNLGKNVRRNQVKHTQTSAIVEINP